MAGEVDAGDQGADRGAGDHIGHHGSGVQRTQDADVAQRAPPLPSAKPIRGRRDDGLTPRGPRLADLSCGFLPHDRRSLYYLVRHRGVCAHVFRSTWRRHTEGQDDTA